METLKKKLQDEKLELEEDLKELKEGHAQTLKDKDKIIR